MLVHNDDNLFECEWCHKMFRSEENMKYHKKVKHTGVKDDVCRKFHNVKSSIFSKFKFLQISADANSAAINFWRSTRRRTEPTIPSSATSALCLIAISRRSAGTRKSTSTSRNVTSAISRSSTIRCCASIWLNFTTTWMPSTCPGHSRKRWNGRRRKRLKSIWARQRLPTITARNRRWSWTTSRNSNHSIHTDYQLRFKIREIWRKT